MSKILFKSRDPAIIQYKYLDDYEKTFVHILSEEPSMITLLYQLSSVLDESNNVNFIDLIKDVVNKGIEDKYPVSFSFFLVLIGIDHYKGGEFWPAVWNTINFSQKTSRQIEWGKLFIEVLNKHKLPNFEDEKAFKYVTPILGHGGIPNYCLPDFFEKLLLPIINGEIESASTSTEEILQEWKLHSSLYLTTDKPVYRFLLLGGKVASDFLTRCIQVAQDIIDGNDLDESFEHSQVPERVVESFREWYDKNKIQIKKKAVSQIKPPQIVFDELENKITCYIPEQNLLDDCKIPVYELRIDNNLITSQKVKSFRYANKTMIDEAEFILPPAENYSIKLINNSSRIRKWEFTGLRNNSVWMAFSDDHNKPLIKRDLLPRSTFWLVCRQDFRLQKHDCIIEEPVILANQWKCFICVRINTEQTTSLSLTNKDELIQLPLSSSKEPFLNKEHLPGWDIDGYPLFTEILPNVHIPFEKSEDLNQWIVTIKTLRQKQNIKKVFRLSDVCLNAEGNEAVIKLSDIALLAERPLGIFNIRLRGKLGNDKEFTFGYIEKFVFVHEGREFYLAEDSPTILIETIPDISLNSTDCCKIQKQENSFCEISVEEGTAKASLDVLYNDNKFVLSFDIPRLMWKLQGVANEDYIGWHSKEFEILIDDLQASQDVTFTVRANLSDGEKCSLQIKETDYKEERIFRSGRAKYDLRLLTDSISYARLPLVSLFLNFDNAKYFDANRCVLKVRTEWTVERNSFSCIDEIKTDTRILWIAWSEKRSLKNRIIRLWDCSRPWREPIDYQIEDRKAEIIIEDKLDVLPAGHYRTEFTVVNEWVVEDEQKFCPKEGDFNVFQINLSGDYIGLTEDFERGLFNVLSTQDTCKLKTPDSFEDAKQLCRVLLFLYHEGKLNFCSNFWREVSTGTCKSFLKDELCNLGNQIESLLPFKKGEIVRWITWRKNVRFEGIIDGFLKLTNDDNSSHSVRLSVINELEVAPSNSKIGHWRKKRS
jgi:hypothetical protein